MSTISSYGYAKVNFYLEVGAKTDGFHMLDSVVGSINLKDKVNLTARRDNKVRLLFELGYKVEGENNVVKAAELFMQTFNTKGVDISLIKHIPIGSGLGGSSADVCAVLSGMKRLFNIQESIVPLAEKLGSDVSYQLQGGFCRIGGRGSQLSPFETDKTYYMLVVPQKKGVSSGECYQRFDLLDNFASPYLGAERMKNALISGNLAEAEFFNGLYAAATELQSEIGEALDEVKALSPTAAFMSGSGSSVVGIYETEELCEWARLKLKSKYPLCFVTRTLKKSEIAAKTRSRSLYSDNTD